ncbi:MAG: ammonium transporter [Chrysiogenetes bacterium]|nr:ammonium transporter [Chrysiogenetes bacterium]
MDSGDTTFILVSAALVLFMTPGLAFFYGGMVRSKNSLSTMMHSFILIGAISVQWVLIGYTLAFGPDISGLIGGLDHIGLAGVGAEPGPYAATIPGFAFMAFQMMFAIITPALISGAFAERVKFSGFLLFSLLWATLVYDPLCHWVWGGGWMGADGAMDFAGGNVVHISAAASAFIFVILLGKRQGFGSEPMPPHNLPFTVLGTGILWFGWFGFNAGSALAADGTAALAFVTTNTAAATASVTWVILDKIVKGKPTVLGAASGAVAGLVAITPAAGFVTPLAAIAMGLGAGVICFFAVEFRTHKGFDDSLDVFAVHGMGGTFGALALGFLATDKGGVEQFLIQLKSVVATYLFAMVMTFVIYKIVDLTVGMRVDEDAEYEGLDLSQHGEVGYNL